VHRLHWQELTGGQFFPALLLTGQEEQETSEAMGDSLFFVYHSIPAILKGLSLTLEIIFITISIGLCIAIPVASIQVFTWRPIAAVMYAYERILRGTPVLFTIFLIYFAGPAIHVELSALLSGIIALGLRSSAYQSQIFRGSMQSVGKGQLEAAESVGMTKSNIIRKIVLPQALRRALPAWSNEWSTMVKDSSLVYVIGVVEMMTRAKMIVDRTGKAIPIFLFVAFIYLIITAAGNKALRYLEKKTSIPGVTMRG
jgi:polar amino acid transport system permease protein